MAKGPASLWRFLRNPENRTILGWLGGGAAAVAAGLWLVVTHYFPPTPATPRQADAPRSDCTITANSSVAACRDVQGGSISIGR